MTPEESKAAPDAGKDAMRSRDEVALELMKFIAVTTGYGMTLYRYGGTAAAAVLERVE